MEMFLAGKRQGLRPRSFLEIERHLCVQAKRLHKQQLAQIDTAAVDAVLAAVDGLSAKNHLRASLCSFFAWALAKGQIVTNPAVGADKADANGARERVLSDDELKDVWAALGDDDYDDIVRLLTLTGARREEIGALQWSEIDLDAALITLPGARTKNKKPHQIQISDPALAILRVAPNTPRGITCSDAGRRDSPVGPHANDALTHASLRSARRRASRR